MFEQTLFVDGQAHRSQRSLTRVHEEMQIPASYAWFCPVCGEVWARSLCANRRFCVTTQPCAAHRDPLLPRIMVSGSLVLPFDKDFNDSLSPALWLREFQLHYKFLKEKEHD